MVLSDWLWNGVYSSFCGGGRILLGVRGNKCGLRGVINVCEVINMWLKDSLEWKEVLNGLNDVLKWNNVKEILKIKHVSWCMKL